MSTNSTITVRTSPTERKSIYCHWDGYLSWNGNMLFNHYNTIEKATALVELGYLSSLRENLEPKDGVHTFENPQNNVCVFYGRDRGESNFQAKVLTNEENIDKQSYNYLFEDGKWYCNGKELTAEMVTE